MKLSFIAVVLLLISIETSAQIFKEKDNFTQMYQEGVRDYRNGNYAAAIYKFTPLTSVSKRSKYSEFSHYYYALASYKLKKYNESRQMLMQLTERFPSWNKMSEVYYLMGVNNLAIKNWTNAQLNFEKIKDTQFQDNVNSIKQHYLQEIVSLSELLNLNKQFPSERLIALEIVDRVDKMQNPSKPDIAFAQKLIKQFNIEIKVTKTKKKIAVNQEKWYRAYLNIAVLLPFRLDAFNTSKRMSNQFAYDYYMGLKMAQEQLQKENVKLNLVPYDVSSDDRQMKDIIRNSDFNSSNMVIGPLYSSTFTIAAEYVDEADILMLNPLSTDVTLINSTKKIYLGHPSIEYQVSKGVEWMKKLDKNLTVAIYYGNTAKDSAMAFSYAKEINQNAGHVLQIQKLGNTREAMERDIKQFEMDIPKHFVYFSTAAGSGQIFLQTLEGRKMENIPVLSTGTSFNLRQAQSAKYSKRLYLLEADFIDKANDKIREFQKKYWDKYSTFPSVYAYLGYDQLLFFGRVLDKYKEKYDQALKLRNYQNDNFEYLLGGFNYEKSNENQIPVILKYNGTNWSYVF